MKALRLLRKLLSDFNLTSGEDAKGKHRQLYEIFQLVLKCQFTPDEYYTYRFFEKNKSYSKMLNYMPNYHSLKYFQPAMCDQRWSFIISNKLLF